MWFRQSCGLSIPRLWWWRGLWVGFAAVAAVGVRAESFVCPFVCCLNSSLTFFVYAEIRVFSRWLRV